MGIDPVSPRKVSTTIGMENPNETLEERLEIEKSFKKRTDEARKHIYGSGRIFYSSEEPLWFHYKKL